MSRAGLAPRRAWWLLFPALVFVAHVVVILGIHPNAPVKDEQFFFPMVQSFHDAGPRGAVALAVNGYGVPQPPLGFILAAGLYELFPYLTALRILNAMLIAFFLATSFRLFQRAAGETSWVAPLAATVLLANPYLHGVATLYYTDALYLALVAAALWALSSERRALLGVALGLLPLVRQFGLFLAVGTGLAALTAPGTALQRVKRALPALVAPLGLLLLAFHWGAATPSAADNQRLAAVRAQYGVFHVDYVFYYLAALGFYLAPVALVLGWGSRKTREKWNFVAGGVVAAVGVSLFPPATNYFHQASGIETLGYLHRLSVTAGSALGPVGLGLVAFLGGGMVVVAALRRTGPAELRFAIPVYLTMQGFNAFAWDKYLLDVIPIVLLAALGPSVVATSPALKPQPRPAT